MFRLSLLLALASSVQVGAASPVHAQRPTRADEHDVRELYDVLSYRLDLRVEPNARSLRGVATVHARIAEGPTSVLQLDVGPDLRIGGVREITGPLDPRAPLRGRRARHERDGEVLRVDLVRSRQVGEEVLLAVDYFGSPGSRDDFFGVHWAKTATGDPWVSTSVQTLGSRTFWPGKDSFFGPGDKPERVFVNLTVPRGLIGVSNGRLTGRTSGAPGTAGDAWETFHWEHPYPLESYSLTVNVAPYVVVERSLDVGPDRTPVPFTYYVLPDSVEKASVQFAEVPKILDVFADWFGPWPFPESKIGIVQTSFLGMEHSTAIAYGSSFPSWCKAHGRPDPWAHRNRWYDYVLVHQLAHEWWGNSVSASTWGHVWIHEGFATYAESLVTEAWHGREKADEFFERTRSWVAEDSRLYRGDGVTSEDAFGAVVYVKGAWVLHMLRHEIDDDSDFWRILRTFQERFRYGSASTEDFQAVVEEVVGRSFEPFFSEWIYGVGYPTLTGTVRATEHAIEVDVANPVRHDTPFHVPLDLAWIEDGRPVERRLRLGPGANRVRIATETRPDKLEVVRLQRLLGRHDVRVVTAE